MFGLKSDSEGENSDAIAFVVVGACQPRHVADGEIVPRVSIRCASRGRGRHARRYHATITPLVRERARRTAKRAVAVSGVTDGYISALRLLF